MTTAIKDTISSVKKQAADVAKEELRRRLTGEKDTSTVAKDPKTKLEETGKGLIQGINPFKKKKKATDTLKTEGLP